MEPRERGIIFCGALIPAVLDGSKTNSRRTGGLNEINKCPDEWRYLGVMDGLHMFSRHDLPPYEHIVIRCPYGGVGDLLYVREAFRVTDCMFPDSIAIDYKSNGARSLMLMKEVPAQEQVARYLAHGRWITGRFMPKWATRRWLRLIAEPVPARVADISEADAEAEGATPVHIPDLGQTWKSYRSGFAVLWDSINKARGYGMKVNPWAWRLEFERTEHESA